MGCDVGEGWRADDTEEDEFHFNVLFQTTISVCQLVNMRPTGLHYDDSSSSSEQLFVQM